MDVQDVAISQIEVSEMNTRKNLHAGTEDSSLNDLTASIRERGLLNPIVVRKRPDGRFDLVAGQRRFLACGSLGWASIPAVVTYLDDHEAIGVSLIENVHRADLHPLDKAQALHQLMQRSEGDISAVARETGLGSTTIRRYLSLLVLPESVKNEVSTFEGPAKIEALHQLTRTFEDPHQIAKVYEQIKPFRQDVQVEIIKQSGGEADRVRELVVEAAAGAFNTKVCRGLGGEMMCEFIPPELAQAVKDMVNKYKLDQFNRS